MLIQRFRCPYLIVLLVLATGIVEESFSAGWDLDAMTALTSG